MLADRIYKIQPSVTLEMTALAKQMQKAGNDVINLSVGEPDFDTPKNIQRAAIEAIEKGHSRYTASIGTPELRNAVCTKMERDNDLNFNSENIAVSCGGKHSLYNICQVLFQKGDKVLIFQPYWVSFPDFVSITGAEPVFVNTDPDHQFEPDFNDLKSKLNGQVKGIIINTPSNPTGGVWRNDVIKEVLKISEKHNLWVIADECYEHFVYDHTFTSIATLSDNPDMILTVQSLSKSYAMTGWRIGYVAGKKEIIKAISKIQGQSTSCPNSIAQYAGVEALTGDQSSIGIMRDIFLKRRNYIIDRLNKINGLTCRIPGGAFYAFPNVSECLGRQIDGKTINTPKELSMHLLNKKNVVTVFGEAFGSKDHIRLSYATSDDKIENAMDRIESELAKLN